MTQTILVIGASHPVGNAFIQAMPDDPAYAVRVAVRLGTVKNYAPRVNVTTVEFDYLVSETFEAAFAGVDKLLFLPPFSNNMLAFTERVVAAATAAGVKHIVLFSAIGAEKASEIPIFQLYRQMEECVEASGIAYTHLRSAPLMDNFLNVHPPDSDGKVNLPLDDAYVAWVAAADVAAVAVSVFTQEGHENKAYNLTGPQAVTCAQATAWISRASNGQLFHEPAPLDDVLLQLEDRFTPWTVESLMALYGVRSTGEAEAIDALETHQFLEEVSDTVVTITKNPPLHIEDFALANASKLGSLSSPKSI